MNRPILEDLTDAHRTAAPAPGRSSAAALVAEMGAWERKHKAERATPQGRLKLRALLLGAVASGYPLSDLTLMAGGSHKTRKDSVRQGCAWGPIQMRGAATRLWLTVGAEDMEVLACP